MEARIQILAHAHSAPTAATADQDVEARRLLRRIFRRCHRHRRLPRRVRPCHRMCHLRCHPRWAHISHRHCHPRRPCLRRLIYRRPRSLPLMCRHPRTLHLHHRRCHRHRRLHLRRLCRHQALRPCHLPLASETTTQNSTARELRAACPQSLTTVATWTTYPSPSALRAQTLTITSRRPCICCRATACKSWSTRVLTYGKLPTRLHSTHAAHWGAHRSSRTSAAASRHIG